jgi:hypothetical protein
LPGSEWIHNAIEDFIMMGLDTPYEDDPHIPSHTRNLAGNLFGISPVDVTYLRDRQKDLLACVLCNRAIQGGNEPTNTIAILPCPHRHAFHLGCIMKHWDLEGKYVHACPKCHIAPHLTHERLGMVHGGDEPHFDTSATTYVDNPFGYIIRPVEPPNIQRIQNYDIPSRLTNARYWQRENLLAAAVENATVSWRGQMVTPEVLERRSGDAELDRMVRSLGHRWRLRNLDRTLADGYETEHAYSSARFAPSEEVAWMRMMRRKRDRNRRNKIAEAGEGLSRYRVQI